MKNFSSGKTETSPQSTHEKVEIPINCHAVSLLQYLTHSVRPNESENTQIQIYIYNINIYIYNAHIFITLNIERWGSLKIPMSNFRHFEGILMNILYVF